MSDQPAYPVLFAKLAEQIPASLVVPDDALAYYVASIAEADALEEGASVESASVLDDVWQVLQIAMPHALAGRVVGYGPVRTRYCMNLAMALAARVDDLDTSRVQAAGASAGKTTTLRGSRDLRTRAVRVLKNLAGRRAEEKQRLKKARAGAEKPDERARALETLAQELEAAMAKVPQSVAVDAGATPELVKALKEAAGAVLVTRGDAKEARSAVASIYDTMNLLDGRLLHELRLLVGAMTDARKSDKTIPAVRSARLASRKKKVVKKVEQPRAASEPADAGASAPAAPAGSGAEAGGVCANTQAESVAPG